MVVRDIERFQSDDIFLIHKIVSMGNSMGLKMESEAVHEQFEYYETEFIIEELHQLHEKKLWLAMCRLISIR